MRRKFNRVVGFSEVITELMRRYNVTANYLAEKTGASRPHISSVASGENPGSLKLVGDCLRVLGVDAELCVILPPDPKTAKHDEEILHSITMALRHGGGNRERVIELYETLERRRSGAKGIRESHHERKHKRVLGAGTG